MSIFNKTFPKILLATGGLALVGALFFVWGERRAKEEAELRHRKESSAPVAHNQALQKFNLTGFDDQGKTFWNLEGDTAQIDPAQTIFLDRSVTLRLRDNTVVRTDHIKWSQEAGLMTTDAVVFVDHHDAKIKGVGAVGRPQDSFIQLNRNIEMIVNRTTHLSCDGPMKVYYKENKIVFYRHVKVIDERGVLKANRMDVYFDPAVKKVSQIVAMGSVVIERGTDTTHSGKAIYTLATGSIRLEGNPELTLHKESSKFLDGAFTN